MNAAWRVGFPLPKPAPPAGGVPEWVVGVPPPAAPAGSVTPCCCRHFTNAVRLVLVLPLADAAAVVDVDVWVVELLELLPHAAITRLVVTAARPRVARRARRWVVLRMVMSCVLCGGVGQPAAVVLVVPALLPVAGGPVRAALAPESFTEVAVIVPFEFFAPWITTVSPGRTDDLETLWLLVTLVAEESVTLTVFPEVSLR